MADISKNYWIGVVSRAHVLQGVEGGFIQLNHGRKTPLQRMRAGDGIILYSPRTSYPKGDILQHFTAIGYITSSDVYQVRMTDDFSPYRIRVQFMPCREAPIKLLIDRLSFVKNKQKWGAPFRFGHLKIPSKDFRTIARAMQADAKASILDFKGSD